MLDKAEALGAELVAGVIQKREGRDYVILGRDDGTGQVIWTEEGRARMAALEAPVRRGPGRPRREEAED